MLRLSRYPRFMQENSGRPCASSSMSALTGGWMRSKPSCPPPHRRSRRSVKRSGPCANSSLVAWPRRLEHTHQEEQCRQSLRCATCAHLLRVRPVLSRTVETLIGEIEVHRPYFYCRHCHRGCYPLDEVLDLRAGRIQLDVQQAAAELATELPYDTASTLFGHLSGFDVSTLFRT